MRQEKRGCMTDRQMQFIAWLITTVTDKCQNIEEVREVNREIRERFIGWQQENSIVSK